MNPYKIVVVASLPLILTLTKDQAPSHNEKENNFFQAINKSQNRLPYNPIIFREALFNHYANLNAPFPSKNSKNELCYLIIDNTSPNSASIAKYNPKHAPPSVLIIDSNTFPNSHANHIYQKLDGYFKKNQITKRVILPYCKKHSVLQKPLNLKGKGHIEAFGAAVVENNFSIYDSIEQDPAISIDGLTLFHFKNGNASKIKKIVLGSNTLSEMVGSFNNARSDESEIETNNLNDSYYQILNRTVTNNILSDLRMLSRDGKIKFTIISANKILSDKIMYERAFKRIGDNYLGNIKAFEVILLDANFPFYEHIKNKPFSVVASSNLDPVRPEKNLLKKRNLHNSEKAHKIIKRQEQQTHFNIADFGKFQFKTNRYLSEFARSYFKLYHNTSNPNIKNYMASNLFNDDALAMIKSNVRTKHKDIFPFFNTIYALQTAEFQNELNNIEEQRKALISTQEMNGKTITLDFTPNKYNAELESAFLTLENSIEVNRQNKIKLKKLSNLVSFMSSKQEKITRKMDRIDKHKKLNTEYDQGRLAKEVLRMNSLITEKGTVSEQLEDYLDELYGE